jgi:alpha-galactosidase
MNRTVFFLFICFISAALNAQKSEKVAAVPPMGWNSWNCFRENVDEG